MAKAAAGLAQFGEMLTSPAARALMTLLLGGAGSIQQRKARRMTEEQVAGSLGTGYEYGDPYGYITDNPRFEQNIIDQNQEAIDRYIEQNTKTEEIQKLGV